jgi:hypothetical protein
MPKLVIKLEATVTATEAEVLTKEGLKLGSDKMGLYVNTGERLPRGDMPRIYPVVKEAYINHDEPIKLGGKFPVKK